MGIKIMQIELFKFLKMLSISTTMLLLLTACADSFNDPCKDGNCDKSKNVTSSAEGNSSSISNNNTNAIGSNSGSSSSSGSTGSSSSGVDSNNRAPTAIGMGSGAGTTSNSTSSNGASTQTGGFGLNTSGNTGESNSNSNNEEQNIYTENFIIVDQLVDKVVETETLFSLQFVVSGAYPLKYEWYKKTSGSDVKIGTNQPVFYEFNANFSHQGIYYVVVTDGKGNKIKSREAKLHVVAGRNACDSGEYAPRYKMDRSGQLDWNFLYDKPYLGPRESYAIQKISPTSDSEFHIMTCNFAVTKGFYFWCNGRLLGHVKYQCQNGKFKMIENSCDCEQFEAGGN